MAYQGRENVWLCDPITHRKYKVTLLELQAGCARVISVISMYKLAPFSLKEFLEVFAGRQKWRDLIGIYHPAKFDKVCKPISLKKFSVNVVKALDHPAPNFWVQ